MVAMYFLGTITGLCTSDHKRDKDIIKQTGNDKYQQNNNEIA
jgi:hypothetical protein